MSGEAEKADSGEEEEKKIVVPKTAAEIQRRKVEKLMNKPDKPVYIPEKKDEKLPRVFNPPEFIRNIWGSSAGVGSGDFHIYRNMRRRQYAREKYMDVMTEKQQKDMEYLEKVEKNAKEAEERTAKKRQKRLKKKMKMKNKKAKKEETNNEGEKEDSDGESSDDEDDEDNIPAGAEGQGCVEEGQGYRDHGQGFSQQTAADSISKNAKTLYTQETEQMVEALDSKTVVGVPSAESDKTTDRTTDT